MLLGRSARIKNGLNVRINMNSYSTGRRSQRSRGGSRRRGNRPARRQREETKEPKKTFWQRIAAFFGNGTTKVQAGPARNGAQPSRSARKPERIEVSSPRLYVGNLSFDATESDLFDLFNGVGHVQNAEVVSYRHNQRSKGLAFVQMQTVEEAKRAVEELHDKEFLGRRLVVSGAKSGEHRAPR
jgi:RNA recognition motif-containing protein